jgi:radical SAM superfamily enzyme YgiQ (UPF0313 family)
MQHALSIIGKRATIPPLGLITVAALLPQNWSFRLVDLNIEALTDPDILWADIVLVGGMRIQGPSIHEIITRAKKLGRKTVVGGPAPTTAPEEYLDADVRFLGEAELKAERLIAAILDPRPGTLIEAGEERPELSKVPVPRYDLLDATAYRTMSLQYSRGCPFRCEFCDIIEIFGRRPRVKSEAQVFDELDCLYRLGYRGSLFFVDDNFIGNKPAVKKLLPNLSRWQAERSFPFSFYTEASLNLAEDVQLMSAMVDAGFSSVFLGIESPSTDSLAGTGKTQNLRRELSESVQIINGHGLEVMGGFIVGFDEDSEGVFQAQNEFIQASPIALAMVGLLMALPGTALSRRLQREGRLRTDAGGDQFARPNFEPAMDEATLLRGYATLMASIYSPESYYQRCTNFLETAPKGSVRKHVALKDVRVLFRTFFYVGVLSPRRWRYWRLLATALRKARHNFAQAVAHAVQGEHLIRYTQEELLPRIEAAIANVEQGQQEPVLAQQASDSGALVPLRVPGEAKPKSGGERFPHP